MRHFYVYQHQLRIAKKRIFPNTFAQVLLVEKIEYSQEICQTRHILFLRKQLMNLQDLEHCLHWYM